MPIGASPDRVAWMSALRQRAHRRAVTLMEVLITIAIVSLVMGITVLGSGSTDSARLKRSGVLIASAVRIAYAHSTAISKPVRLVFDFEQRTVSLEESSETTFSITKNDK